MKNQMLRFIFNEMGDDFHSLTEDIVITSYKNLFVC